MAPRELVERLTPNAMRCLEAAVLRGVDAGHHEIGVAHLVLELLGADGGDAALLCAAARVDRAALRRHLLGWLGELATAPGRRPGFARPLLELLEDAWRRAERTRGAKRIRSGDVFLAFLRQPWAWLEVSYPELDAAAERVDARPVEGEEPRMTNARDRMAVGETWVHADSGVFDVVALESRTLQGASHEMLVLVSRRLSPPMNRMMVPADRPLPGGWRRPITAEEAERALAALEDASPVRLRPGSHLRRQRTSQQGEPSEWVELLRELGARAKELKLQPPTKHQLLATRDRLADELAAALDADYEAMGRRVDAAIASVTAG